MKTYKHKTTGYIATLTHSGKNYKVSYPQNYTIPKWIVENSNDWQEIIEPKYSLQDIETIIRTKTNALAITCNEIIVELKKLNK